jgi:hypothetical protein
MGVLKGTGFLSGEQEGKKEDKKLSPALAERLLSALEASNDVERLRNTDAIEAEVVIES